jgi:hypothetical protein
MIQTNCVSRVSRLCQCRGHVTSSIDSTSSREECFSHFRIAIPFSWRGTGLLPPSTSRPRQTNYIATHRLTTPNAFYRHFPAHQPNPFTVPTPFATPVIARIRIPSAIPSYLDRLLGRLCECGVHAARIKVAFGVCDNQRFLSFQNWGSKRCISRLDFNAPQSEINSFCLVFASHRVRSGVA